MRRDMNFMRDLLEQIEDGQKAFTVLSDEVAAILCVPLETPMSRENAQELEEHLNLLEEAGLINIAMRSGGGFILVERLTGAGHDFLAAAREPKVWNGAKGVAEKAGGWTVSIITEVVKAAAKHEAAKLGWV